MSFKDKVVLVTGASSGIGAAVTVAFSAEGAQMVMVGRNETRLAIVAKICNNPFVLRADVANDVDARRIVDLTIEKFGRLDVLVNNAGIACDASLLSGDIMKAYDTLTCINLRAAIHLTSLAAKHLIKSKGNIVNISSIAGKLPILPCIVAYAVSKAGLNHFGEYAAMELAPYGVRVNTVSPGPVRTNIIETSELTNVFDESQKFTALNRVSEPKEIADIVLFLASDKATSITGSNYFFDNGLSIKRGCTF